MSKLGISFLLFMWSWGGNFVWAEDQSPIVVDTSYLSGRVPIFPNVNDMDVLQNLLMTARSQAAVYSLMIQGGHYAEVLGAAQVVDPPRVRELAAGTLQMAFSKLENFPEARAQLTELYLPALQNLVRSQNYGAVALTLPILEMTSLSPVQQFNLALEAYNELKKGAGSGDSSPATDNPYRYNIDTYQAWKPSPVPPDNSKRTHVINEMGEVGTIETELREYLEYKARQYGLRAGMEFMKRRPVNRSRGFSYNRGADGPAVLSLQHDLESRFSCRLLFKL